ncbi:hypothetical protein CPB84DRAFT_1853704 [Gymnopilus junonius]|uniref:F-box domain-containing protein n=1 Tax=Gymnopilus junonius TaxID=109634 RepID=A0A9P5NB34_GYMJU|nr:hypothetical protein CPB84DRAFT_1853704 [Gymnopilus junonius]
MLGQVTVDERKLLQELAVFDGMVQTKSEHATFQSTAQRSSSPILRIPIELTSSIFRAAIGGLSYDNERKAEKMLYNLSHVCEAWRLIALSLPDLWTSFTSTNPSNSDLERLTAHLSRSDNKFLDLHFELNTTIDKEAFKGLMKIATRHITRWKRFVLRSALSSAGHFIPNAQYWRNFFKAVFIEWLSAPNLEVIDIVINPSRSPLELVIPSNSDLPEIPYFQGGAPKLAQARFDSWSLMACKPLSHNVTTLHIGDLHDSGPKYPFTAFLDILASSQLTDLSLSGNIFRQRFEQNARPVLSPELKHIRLANCWALASNIFQYLRAPKLELLVLIRMSLNSSWTFPEAEYDPSAPLNIFPSIRSLAFIDCNTSITCVEHLADITRAATDLYIDHDFNVVTPGSDLFCLMAQTPEANILWPNLCTMHCRIDQLMEGHSDFNIFLDVITRRWETLKKHCVLKLHDEDAQAWEEYDPETWSRLVEGGFYDEWLAADEVDFVPWPPRATQKFDRLWEDEFITSYGKA